jgi:hypothetical protein
MILALALLCGIKSKITTEKADGPDFGQHLTGQSRTSPSATLAASVLSNPIAYRGSDLIGEAL